jgi:hypothetical protein
MELTGTYGSNQTPCTVFGYAIDGVTWYTVEGSVNVNLTRESLQDGVWVETLTDTDCFTSSEPITSTAMLEEHCAEVVDYLKSIGNW